MNSATSKASVRHALASMLLIAAAVVLLRIYWRANAWHAFKFLRDVVELCARTGRP